MTMQTAERPAIARLELSYSERCFDGPAKAHVIDEPFLIGDARVMRVSEFYLKDLLFEGKLVGLYL